MKIQFVRGPFLNPWELQSYAGIAKTHSFTALGGDWQYYQAPFEIPGISIQKGRVWGHAFPNLNMKTLYNRALSWTLGRSYGFYDFDENVAQADILHAAELHNTLTYQCIEVKRRRKVSVVLTVWENLLHMGETHPIRQQRKREVIRQADGFLAVTQTTQKMLLEEGVPSERIMTLPMAIDIKRFRPTTVDRARWGFNSEDFIVLFMGRWVEEKGVLDLLTAIPLVLNALPHKPIRFCFIGAGPLEKAIRDACERYPQFISMHPFLSYEDIPAFHNLADLFVLPSKARAKWEEQFGYVLIESMACGKAVVSTTSGSIPDVVRDAGLLTSPGNPTALADTLLKAINTPGLRHELGQKARSRAETVFSVEAITPSLENFYQMALQNALL